MNQSRGDWFLTYTGRQFWILDQRPEDICIENIAHQLALQTRYKGSCRRSYSIAQHCVLAQELATGVRQFGCLMHDAPEAYTGDRIGPINYLPQVYAVLKPIEDRIWQVLCGVYGLDVDKDSKDNSQVKEVGNWMMMMEQRGRVPANRSCKSFPKCRYCSGDHSTGVFTGDRGAELFKCHHIPCPTNYEAVGEVGFLRHELALSSRKGAAVPYLKEAGVWKEKKSYVPSTQPGATRRKRQLPDSPSAPESQSNASATPEPATDGSSFAAMPVDPHSAVNTTEDARADTPAATTTAGPCSGR